MTAHRELARLRDEAPGFVAMLGGQIHAVDAECGACTMLFDIGREFCHSVDIVQGGFITAMLDTAMSQAALARDDTIVALATLEISTRYLDVSRAGKLTAVGRIVKLTHKTAFLEGELRHEDGHLLASAQTVAKLRRRAPQ